MRSHPLLPGVLLGVALVPPVEGQVPILDLPATAAPTTSTTLPAALPGVVRPPAHGGARSRWPTLPPRGKGIEAFRLELERSRAVLEEQRVAGEIDDSEYVREIRQYRRLLAEYVRRVR